MTWTDTADVAIALCEAHPNQRPLELRFTDLHKLVLALPGFTGEPGRSNEKILEAIQMLWLEESEG